jgi:putative addiction module killer protein
MIKVIQSPEFQKWHAKLKDIVAQAKIQVRLDRIEDGNFGDVKPVGAGVSEARIPHGAGYRLYFIQKGASVIVMLGGGDKSSQERDIKKAKELAQQWR